MSLPSEYKGNHFPIHFLCSLLCYTVNIPAKNKAAQLRAVPLGNSHPAKQPIISLSEPTHSKYSVKLINRAYSYLLLIFVQRRFCTFDYLGYYLQLLFRAAVKYLLHLLISGAAPLAALAG